MAELSEMVKRIQGSERAQRKINIPKGTIRLDSGEPDFPTPVHIQEAAMKALRDNFTHYGNAYGDQELREAICSAIRRDYGSDYGPENVLITAGGVEAVHLIAGTYLNPGDEAVVIDPDYSAYAETISLFGAKPVYVPTDRNLRIDLKQIENHVSNRTKMIFLSNPCNPTGNVLSESEVRGLARTAREKNILIVVDEVYHKLIYDDAGFFSICQVGEVRDRAILLNSFSKTYAMTGWRVGYLVADARIIKDLVGLHKSALLCVSSFSQKACIAALRGPQDCVESMRKEYDRRRKRVTEILGGIDRILTHPCRGAFYFFPRFNHNLTSRELTDYLSEKKLLVRSGTEFGENGQQHFRITFATSVEVLEEGLSRLKNALAELD